MRAYLRNLRDDLETAALIVSVALIVSAIMGLVEP